MKTVNLSLVGVNGNAFALLGAFAKQARKEKWSDEEIQKVTNKALSKDYDHLLRVLDSHCREKSQDD